MKVRNLTLTACLLASCVWCFSLVSQANSAEPSSAGFKPVASVEGLMNGQVLVFKQIGKLVANENAPKRIKRIHAYAEVLAELANVNTFNSEKTDYQGWAGDLRDESLELSVAAKKGADSGSMSQIMARMKATCESCHDVYQ